MCVFSGSGQIAFGLLMALCVVCTGVAAFWQGEGQLHTWSCLIDKEDCTKLESENRGYMQLVAGFICTSLILEIWAVMYNCSVFCICFSRHYALYPLSWFAYLVFGFLLTAIIIFTAIHKSGNGYYPLDKAYGWGYIYLTFAVILSFLDLIIACVVLCFAEVSVLGTVSL